VVVLDAAPPRGDPAKVRRERAAEVLPADGGPQAPVDEANRAALPLTREALWRAFPADIREMVYRWDPHDPRTEEERRRALFDFMYEGFDSAAWVPQSLFKRKEVLAPFGDPDAIITRTIGLIGWPQNRAARTLGQSKIKFQVFGKLAWPSTRLQGGSVHAAA
jgi:hypothetical protein